MEFNPYKSTLAQAYLAAFAPGGLKGLTDRSTTLRWMGFRGLVTQPTTAYRRDSHDGPYSPLSHTAVDAEFGGEERLLAVNDALAAAGIAAIGDFVPNHLDEQSEEVRRTLRGRVVDDSWFRVSRDPEVVATWQGKTNIFGLPATLWQPELDAWRASTFYGDQWELDVEHPEVALHLEDAALNMVEGWGYGGLRLDAIAYAAGKRLTTPTGEHEPAAFALTRRLRRRLGVTPCGHHSPLLIAEAGGTTRQIARWIGPGVADAAYDFTWGPTLVRSLDIGEWTPLREYWAALPETAGRWLRFLGSHDERQLRYVPFRDELIATHGGRDGEFACFGGNGLTLPFRNLVPSEEAFMTLLAMTVLSDGLPLVFQTDMGGWRGDIRAAAKDVRDPNRCLVPWNGTDGGWRLGGGYPMEPTWRSRSVKAQLMDPGSVMARLAQLIHLRAHHPAFDSTRQRRVPSSSPAIEAFVRGRGDRALVVVANASQEPANARLDLRPWRGWRLRRLSGISLSSVDRAEWSAQKFIGAGEHEVGLRPGGFDVLELAPAGV